MAINIYIDKHLIVIGWPLVRISSNSSDKSGKQDNEREMKVLLCRHPYSCLLSEIIIFSFVDLCFGHTIASLWADKGANLKI